VDQRTVTFHEPALLDEVERLLAPEPGKVIVDATVGGGGHAKRLLSRILPGGFLIALDCDEEAVREASRRLDSPASVLAVRENFANLAKVTARMRFSGVDGILADLGVSSHQLNAAARGFSFRRPGPLDMRFSRTLPRTAADVVNRAPEKDLERILREYGEEPFARRIARAMAAGRPFQTTGELADAVSRAVPLRTRLHPATRTFQALRIAVNDELGSLHAFLAGAPGLLKPGGTLCVISYHSLEDRRVKQAFRALPEEGFEILTEKPLTPCAAERARNPRSRSAKLRGVRRRVQ
jgi:16S rRNA (cytosine1402-N4)-methyltransferase